MLVLISTIFLICKTIADRRTIDPIGVLDVKEITDGLYFYGNDSGVIVVDGPPSIGPDLCDMVSTVTDIQVTHVIYSHPHRDHVGNVGCYQKYSTEDIIYIAHFDAQEYLLDHRSYNAQNTPPADILLTFNAESSHTSNSRSKGWNTKDTESSENGPEIINSPSGVYTLELGGKKLKLSQPEQPHSDGDLWIYAPQHKVLMIVDVVYSPNFMPFDRWGLSENLSRYRKSLDIIEDKFNWKYLVSGHLQSTGTHSDVDITKRLYDEMFDVMSIILQDSNERFAKAATDNGGFNGENTFTIFTDFTDKVTNDCIEEMANRGWGSDSDKMITDYNAFVRTFCQIMYNNVATL